MDRVLLQNRITLLLLDEKTSAIPDLGTIAVERTDTGTQASLALYSPGDSWNRITGVTYCALRLPMVRGRRKLSWMAALFVLMAMGCLVRGRPKWGLLRAVGRFRKMWNEAKR
jgi:hypothetical protein